MKTKTVSESQEEATQLRFKMKIWEYAKDKLDIYPKWLLRDFCFYWTAKNDNGRKMYFEMEKRWSTGLRLSTWRQRSLKDPRWKESKGFLNYFNLRAYREMGMQQSKDYRKHLTERGYKFGGGDQGRWVLSPDNERTWI